MKKYYSISPMNEVSYIGEFEEFKDCWDFVNYDSNIRYVWILSEDKLKYVFRQIEEIIKLSGR